MSTKWRHKLYSQALISRKPQKRIITKGRLMNIAIQVAAFGLIKRSLTPPPAIDGCWEGVFGMLGYATLTGSYPERYPK